MRTLLIAVLIAFLAPAGLATEKTGKDNKPCLNSHVDCNDDTLICASELSSKKEDIEFDKLKICIYGRVALKKTKKCCSDFVLKNQRDDPDFNEQMKFTPAPTVAREDLPGTGDGAVEECKNQRTSKECMGWGACKWDYWSRYCRPIKFDHVACEGSNLDCKPELARCIQMERDQGRAPQLRNLEPCVIMNEQSDCCQLFTNGELSLRGPKRTWRPDRYDKENCELYKRNRACKNQVHCQWRKTDKQCIPMKGIKAPGLWYVPEMSCGYKGFKLSFVKRPEVLKRNIKTSCDCALQCESYLNWTWRQNTNKCGCTNELVKKVARQRKGWWGSATKHAPQRKTRDNDPLNNSGGGR